MPRLAHGLRALRQEAGGLSYRELARRAGYSVTALSQAAAGEKLPTLPVALAYVAACGGDPEEWEDRWRTADAEHLAELAADALVGSTPPYRGLARFEPEDEALFFGRGRLTEELVELVAAHRFTVVFGPSGSGKSSLLRAGLIPRLRTSPAPPAPLSPPAALRIFTPGEHPMRSRRDLLVPAADDGETWLVVDQFEEVFTLCSDAEERTEFLTALLAARRDDSRLRVVLGVRADFYGHCLADPGLAAAVKEAALPVGPLAVAELREAVVKPAAAAGLVVERALTARLVEEVAGEPGSLPLLSHALLETWRRRRGRTLTLEGHLAAGGLHGAIVQTAEDLYAQLTPDQAEEARRILLSLITPGDGAPDTRRPVERPEVVPDGPASDAHTVLDRLVEARLVTLDRDTVDLAHEALITAWPRLSGWIDESRERLRRHRRLAQAAHNWRARQRDSGALLRGGELAEAAFTFAAARDRRELTPQEREFLRASCTARTRARWARRAVVSTLAVLVVLAVVAVETAWREGRTSQHQREESAARRLASLAQGVRASDPVLAMRLGLTAWQLKQTTETRSALLGAYTQPETDTYDVPDGTDGTDVMTLDRAAPLQLSRDGRTAVTSDMSGVRAWDVTTRKALGPLIPLGADTSVVGVAPDGRTALLGSWDGKGKKFNVRTWDLRAGKPVGVPLRTDRWGAGYAPDGRTLVEVEIEDDGGTLGLRDGRTGRTVFERSTSTGPAWALSPDARLLALCPDWHGGRKGKETAAFELWDVRERRKLSTTWPGACAAEPPEFTGDGQAIMVRSADGLSLRDAATGRERTRIRHAGLTEAVTSPDGQFVVAADSREILLWRLSSPKKPVFRFPLANEVPTELRIDTAAGAIRYVTNRHRMDTVVRTVSYGPAMGSAWSPQPIGKGVFSRDGRTLAVERRRGNTSYFEAYSVPDGARTARTPGVRCARATLSDTDCHTLLALSPDGRTLVHGRTTLYASDGPKEFRAPNLWDVRADAPARPLVDPRPPHSATLPMTGLAFTADGRSLLVTRYGMDAVDVWDLDRRQRTRPETQSKSHATVSDSSIEHPNRLLARPDGRLVVTPRYLFALPSGLTAGRSPNLDDASAFAFSPAGDRLAAGDSSGGVTLWDGDVRKRRGALVGTQNAARRGTVEAVTALAFSSDGKTLAVGGGAGTLQLWDVASGQPLGSPLPTPGDGIVAVTFAADGRTVHGVGVHSGIQSHAIDPGRLTAAVCKRAGGGLSPADWRTYLPDIPYRPVC